MGALRQFPRAWTAWAMARRGASIAALFLAGGLCAGIPLWADSGQPGAIGRVEGRDISVESGTAGGGSQSSPSILVTNGSVITVHSGHAHLTLFAGGEVEVCGPAKLTLLQSSDAITLALNFGRVRAKLPTKTSLRVFTPTIIATPIDISGGTRDIAVGLSLDDSLCVLASSGAIQLEHQFSGERLIVPQAGEFFLNSGQLLPVAGTPGSCECDASDAPALQPGSAAAPEQYAVVVRTPDTGGSAGRGSVVAPTSPAIPVPAPALAAVPPAASPGAPQQSQFEPIPMKSEPDFDLQLLARASQLHPVSAIEKPEAPAQPPVSVPASVTIASPLVFMASAPSAPAAPGPDMILLIREAKVSPDWEFTGHVDAPAFAVAVQHALGEAPPRAPQPPAEGSTAERPHGFWAALKRIFVGSGTVTD